MSRSESLNLLSAKFSPIQDDLRIFCFTYDKRSKVKRRFSLNDLESRPNERVESLEIRWIRNVLR